MRIRHGVTVTFMSATSRDEVGDVVTDDSWQVHNVGVTWPQPVAGAVAVDMSPQNMTSPTLFVDRSARLPKSNDAATLPDGSKWSVVGVTWNQVSPLTGTDFGLCQIALRGPA